MTATRRRRTVATRDWNAAAGRSGTAGPREPRVLAGTPSPSPEESRMIPSARRLAILLGALAFVAMPWSAGAQAPGPDYLKKAQDLVKSSMKPPAFADVRPA